MINNNGNGNISKELEFLQAYPLQTEATGASSSPATRASSSTPIGQLVEGTLREVLAWRPRSLDVKGFVAALNQSFDIVQVDGHTEWSWTPRSYAIQADMGAVTGAQASIYSRAKNALDQSVPLLEGLYPLRPDADLQDAEAARSLVQAAAIELVGELGQVGGPRLQRVDAHLVALLGRSLEGLGEDDAERVGGLLGLLRDRFGMERRRVNTIAEEQNLTNYLILVDHMTSLRRNWNAQRHYFDRRGTDVFLGTQLVLLSRALAVMGDAAETAADALDSVYIRAAERQVTQLPLLHHNQREFPLTIDELLSWIEKVANEEGPRAINDGGKDGVVTLQPILSQLHALAIDFLRVARRDFSGQHRDLPPGLFTPRVVVALEGLESSVGEANALASKLRRVPGPRVEEVEIISIQTVSSANSIPQVNRVRLFVVGEGFEPNVQAALRRIGDDRATEAALAGSHVFPAMTLTRISDTALRVSFDLTGSLTTNWRLLVTNPDGGTGTFDFVISGFDRPPLPPPPAPQPPEPQSPEPTEVTLAVNQVQFLNGDRPKRSVRVNDLGTTQSFSASKDGIDTVVIVFDQDLDNPGSTTDSIIVASDTEKFANGFIQGKTVRIEHRDAAGKLPNLPVGKYTITIPQDTSSLLKDSTLSGELIISFEIKV